MKRSSFKLKSNTKNSSLLTIGSLLVTCVASLLTACGGANDSASTNAPTSAQSSIQIGPLVATGTTTLQVDVPNLPDAAAMQIAQPAFHLAPVLLNTPEFEDSAVSALLAPHTQAIPTEFKNLSTRRLTVSAMEIVRDLHNRNMETQTQSQLQSTVDSSTVSPAAATTAVSTYTPAQIRAAYGLPAIPATTNALTPAQAAQLGAGQTIYIVDAMHDPNVAAELTTFNQKFGLPACTTKTISATTALPLATASASSCEFAVVYNTASGTLTATAPAYDSGWATEIALDVQWAHATAPLARIILIEAVDASLNSLIGGVKLANAMGPGVVSMSFGATEGNWTGSVDAAFAAANMTYLAATGDSGAAVEWPSVSPNVLAVGGTSLSFSGTGTRSEVSWSGTGGGTSAYIATPAYQSNAVPGMGTVARRTVADVSFNADPSTGQYVAIIPSGSSAASWVSAGGTSLSTPQWAGIIAIANASRALTAKSALGGPHAVLYGQISTVPGAYASAFADITKGSDGTCATCSAKIGYDSLSGLGTPNISNLLTSLSGASMPVTAPVVTPASIAGKVGTALSFTVSATSANPLTYSLSGAPSGMTISNTGAVTWATPVLGTYSVLVTVKDSKTGLSGQAIYTITITAATTTQAPVVNATTILGKAGTALSFSVSVTASNPVTYTMTGAPAGMTISVAGIVSWATPITGNYAVTVIAKDSKTGLSGQGIFTVTISTTSVSGPVITVPTMVGVAGKALSGTIGITDPGATSLSITISGAPMGMSFSMSGMNVIAAWASPVTGSYSLSVSVVDSAGRTAKVAIPITINAK
ncbi:S53 family peptidase [Undibacterium sp. RTI2.1]|uniref:S53 family peptidase n=1 Tax=unclassified Undibacterium TaxID=2630295 RepID=UPI002B230E43|nr:MULTISPECIES: S53 family peptidase [unclassified Undibacterium]MEB0030543.1 S53 family peptidase [Undibacterium sp. RTI2.1]MEB0116956.1 S53 family peptidase [Undibacterium sp. RTI2.2]